MRKELHESVFNTYEFWNAFFPLLTKWKKRHFSLAKIVNKLINVENTFEIAHISQLNKLEFIFKKEKRTVWLRIVLKWAWEKGVGKSVWKQYSECTLVFCGVLFLDIIDFFLYSIFILDLVSFMLFLNVKYVGIERGPFPPANERKMRSDKNNTKWHRKRHKIIFHLPFPLSFCFCWIFSIVVVVVVVIISVLGFSSCSFTTNFSEWYCSKTRNLDCMWHMKIAAILNFSLFLCYIRMFHRLADKKKH